jgi:hypothetical protein
VKSAKIELLTKVVTWRMFSMCYGFSIAYFFTGNVRDSAGIVLITGTTLTLLQWTFEIIWDKHVRSKLRNAISREQGGVGRLVWWRRGSRDVSVDEHEPGTHEGKEIPDPATP